MKNRIARINLFSSSILTCALSLHAITYDGTNYTINVLGIAMFVYSVFVLFAISGIFNVPDKMYVKMNETSTIITATYLIIFGIFQLMTPNTSITRDVFGIILIILAILDVFFSHHFIYKNSTDSNIQ